MTATVPVYLILLIALAHFVGDFMVQDDETAKGKSKSNFTLTYHVLTMGAVLSLVPSLLVSMRLVSLVDGLAWLLVNLIAHWITDYFTSRATTRLWFLVPQYAGTMFRITESNEGGGSGEQQSVYWITDTGTRHNFFVMVGLDQLLHMATLYVTAALWLT